MSQPPGSPPPPGEPQHPSAPHSPPSATPVPPAATPRRRRAPLITSIVLGVVLLLCGGGGTTAYFLLKNVAGTGTATPTAAVEGFLTAVFRDHDVEKANSFVCPDARSKAALGKKIEELRSYEQQYKSPRYSWPTPSVQARKDKTATLTVPVKITTADERVAEKRLKFVAVDESGWWVCEVGDAG
jgi:hypothetical protein